MSCTGQGPTKEIILKIYNAMLEDHPYLHSLQSSTALSSSSFRPRGRGRESLTPYHLKRNISIAPSRVYASKRPRCWCWPHMHLTYRNPTLSILTALVRVIENIQYSSRCPFLFFLRCSAAPLQKMRTCDHRIVIG